MTKDAGPRAIPRARGGAPCQKGVGGGIPLESPLVGQIDRGAGTENRVVGVQNDEKKGSEDPLSDI